MPGTRTISTAAGERATPASALVVCAHPDDVDFGAAGTVATLTDAGTTVSYLLVTDGDSGGFDFEVPRTEIAGIRRREQRAAAACVGVDDLHFLGHPDGYLQVTLELRRDIARVIRTVRPEVVIAQSPERNWDRIYASHPDHLATGEATIAAVYPDARNPFAFPELRDEGLEAHTATEIWLMGGGTDVNLVVDISDAVERKIAALRAHRSQTAHHDDLEGMIWAWTAANARDAGLAVGRFAEVFRVIDTH